MLNKKNEVILFVFSVFILNALLKGLTLCAIWLFRIFGMPQLYVWYSGLHNVARWRFYIVLLVCTVVSIVRILRLRNK